MKGKKTNEDETNKTQGLLTISYIWTILGNQAYVICHQLPYNLEHPNNFIEASE